MSAAFVHASAVVDDDVAIGEGTRIWHFVHVSSGARIGRNCALGQNVFVGRNVEIGNGVRIQNNVSVYEGVVVSDDAFLGPSCVFTNVINPRAFVERSHEFKDTHVGRGVSIGANATIVCGHSLGDYCFIGAGAVITRDVPPYALMVGNPGRRIGWMCRCGERLPGGGGEVACAACKSRFTVSADACVPLV